MPTIDREQIGIAFDMLGCPNRCRHCWLGSGSHGVMSEEDVRWGVSKFREFIQNRQSSVRRLAVATWFREPDFSPDFRRLYDLEAELGDGKPNRFELLSIWRLARDRSYAAWAKTVGPDTCQISFAGMKQSTDWFYRRNGAFSDALTATERLLEAGIKPRWQLFLTTKLLPEVNDFLELIHMLRLVDRVKELGGDFQVFMNLPGPEHEGRKIEQFRPTADQAASIPESILKASRNHLNRETLWQTEATLYDAILSGSHPQQEVIPEVLWFFVCNNWDVFSNAGTLEPWWCLGNLKRDSVESMLRRFEEDDIPGLSIMLHTSTAELAEIYGNPEGQNVYSYAEDLTSLYRAQHCEKEWNNGSRLKKNPIRRSNQ